MEYRKIALNEHHRERDEDLDALRAGEVGDGTRMEKALPLALGGGLCSTWPLATGVADVTPCAARIEGIGLTVAQRPIAA